MSQERTITIPLGEYLQLKEDSLLLECLEGCGVDNWEGWDDAHEEYERISNEEEDD